MMKASVSTRGGWRDPSQMNVRRSMALMAVGALVGLALAGYALFTARGTSTLVVPPEAVALVNQQIISRVDFIAQLQTLYGTDLKHSTANQRKKVLDDMIREELLVQRGKELDVSASDSDVRSAMVNAVELEIAADAITANPTEVQLHQYYDAHLAKYASEGIMSVKDYVFPIGAEDQATAASRALSAPTPPSGMLEGLQRRDSGKTGPDEFYFAAKIHLGDKLFGVARGLATGAVSAPLVANDGIHVLYMLKNLHATPLAFAAARSQVLTDYRNDAITRLRAADESFLTKRANILIADDMR